VVRREGEEAKVAIRNIRATPTASSSPAQGQEDSEDVERQTQDEIQKLTDRHIQDVDKTLAAKEAELMEI